MKQLFSISILLLILVSSCKKNQITGPSDTAITPITGSSSDAKVYDVDSNLYPTVKIGTQVWFKKNLRVSHYRNGDPILNGFSHKNFNWNSDTRGAFTFPNGNKANNNTYGKLYSYYAVTDPRGICPTGWHIPSDDEWKTLEMYEGMTQEEADASGSRGSIGTKLLEGGSSGLNLQRAGILFPVNGGYYYFGTQGYFYSSTDFDGIDNWYRGFNVGGNIDAIYRQDNNYCMSVRCIKD